MTHLAHAIALALWLPGVVFTAWIESQLEAWDRATDWRLSTRMMNRRELIGAIVGAVASTAVPVNAARKPTVKYWTEERIGRVEFAPLTATGQLTYAEVSRVETMFRIDWPDGSWAEGTLTDASWPRVQKMLES